MKKIFALISLFLAIAFQSFAQDTITGVVNRVGAPFFEQNVCDSRFAIVSEGETYYVMVDNYWPNPYLEDLVIHYDTIPIGNEIEVVGEIMEMEDGNGAVFKTIDISKNFNSTHQQSLGFFGYSNISYPGPNAVSSARFVHYSGTYSYYITINGELQMEKPLVVNGRVLVESKRYLFIGSSCVWTDYYGNTFNVFELADVLPYDVEDRSISGTLTTENDLCLSWPREENSYLSVFDGELHHYVTNKGVLKNRYTLYDIRNVFGNNTLVEAGGVEAVRYDLFGSSFNTMEVIKMETEEQTTLTGMLTDAGTPYIGMGPPIPGVEIAFYSHGIHYIENPQGELYDPQFSWYNYFIVGNDTIPIAEQTVTATFIPRMIMNNYRNPVFYILITEVDGATGVQETNPSMILVYPNPSNGLICISSENQEIMSADILDACGRLLLSESCDNNKIIFNNFGARGLLFLRIKLKNGHVVFKKIVVR